MACLGLASLRRSCGLSPFNIGCLYSACFGHVTIFKFTLTAPTSVCNMPAGNIDDDDYVANLLKEEAKESAKRYELVGVDAFKPKRCVISFSPTVVCAPV